MIPWMEPSTKWRNCSSLWRLAASACLRSVISTTMDWMAGTPCQSTTRTCISSHTSAILAHPLVLIVCRHRLACQAVVPVAAETVELRRRNEGFQRLQASDCVRRRIPENIRIRLVDKQRLVVAMDENALERGGDQIAKTGFALAQGLVGACPPAHNRGGREAEGQQEPANAQPIEEFPPFRAEELRRETVLAKEPDSDPTIRNPKSDTQHTSEPYPIGCGTPLSEFVLLHHVPQTLGPSRQSVTLDPLRHVRGSPGSTPPRYPLARRGGGGWALPWQTVFPAS